MVPGIHIIYDINGVLTDSAEWNRYSRVYAWNPVNNRVYFFRDQTSPNDLHYEEINQTTGAITAAGETPYHGDYAITPPIRISRDGSKVLLGSGDLYEANTLNWLGALGTSVIDAVWMADGGLISMHDTAGQTVLRRRDISLNSVVEIKSYAGTPVAIFASGADFVVLTQGVTGVEFHIFQPSDDSDNDGVLNDVDRFPLDAAASVDTDHDGYPDSWNIGYSQADSTTGLSLDSYPLDSACYLPEHGDGVLCDYTATMPVFTPDKVVMDANGVAYLLSTSNNRIFRWSANTSSFINPIYVGSTNTLSAASPTQLVYSDAHQRLYLGYPGGAITYIDLTGDLTEQAFSNLPTTPGGLAAVGNYLLAQDGSGAWNTHYIFDISGALTDSVDWNRYSRAYAWNSVNNRVYFFRDQTSPNDLHYEEINQLTGVISAAGETPYHGDYIITPPIRISQDGSKVLLGSGDIYDANTLTWLASLGSAVNDAAWFTDIILTVTENTSDSLMRVWDAGSAQPISQYLVTGKPVALLPYGLDVIRVYTDVNGVGVAIEPVGDHDLDGLPAWWENLYGLDDANALDAVLDNDADGLTNLQEFNLQTSPNNADTDGDGLNDNVEISTTLTNPLIADTDGDTIIDGDEVNLYGTNPLLADSDADGLTDDAEINQYGTNPLANDTDADGMPDAQEVAYGFDPLIDDASADADSDGLSNIQELALNTDPNNNDTDADGLLDGDEVNIYLTNPLVLDSDGDRISDGWEIANGFDPLDVLDGALDTDADGFSNMAEYFLKSNPNDILSVPTIPVWATYQGGPSHTGFMPVVLDASTFALRWNVSPMAGRALNPVTAADGKVFVSERTYFGTNQTIAALNAVDGSQLWANGYGNINAINPPAYASGNVYFQTGGHGDSYLRGLDANTGALVFRSSFANQWSRYLAPTPFAGNIYINGGSYGGAYGFDDSSGAQLWFASLSQYDSWTPAVDENYIYAYTNSFTVINRLTGSSEYTIPDPGNPGYGSSINAAPVLGSQQNALVVNNGRLISFDLQNRSIAWQLSANFGGQPSLALGRIYTISSGALSVRDEITGDSVWTWEPPASGSVSGNMVVTMNLIFLRDATSTYAVDLDTHLAVWSYPAAGHLSLSNEGTLYIATGTGSLVAITVGN